MIGCQWQSKRLKRLVNFLSCHGPLGVDQVAPLSHRGKDRRRMKKHRQPKHQNNKQKWQEVTKDNGALISNRAKQAESEGHSGWVPHPEGDSLQAAERITNKIIQPDPSVPQPSIISLHHSSQQGRGREMKRPHDYSSPDSDTDEFIDVGQEDSYWWASFNHTWVCNMLLPIVLEKKITQCTAVFSRQI